MSIDWTTKDDQRLFVCKDGTHTHTRRACRDAVVGVLVVAATVSSAIGLDS